MWAQMVPENDTRPFHWRPGRVVSVERFASGRHRWGWKAILLEIVRVADFGEYRWRKVCDLGNVEHSVKAAMTRWNGPYWRPGSRHGGLVDPVYLNACMTCHCLAWWKLPTCRPEGPQ